MEIKKGKLIRWVDAKSFGFIKPENGKGDIFIHITAFKHKGRKPVLGDTIHYETGTDTSGKTRAVNAKIEGVNQSLKREQPLNKRKKETFKRTKSRVYRKTAQPKNSFNILPAVILIGIAFFVYSKVAKEPNSNLTGSAPVSSVKSKVLPLRPVSHFQCEGKIWCTDMRSFEEAIFYLRNCPGTKLDGDGDGIPCERQFQR